MTSSIDPLVREFDALCRRYPDRPLVSTADRSWTVADVHDIERTLGLQIDVRALGERRIVGLHMANGPIFLAALIALRRSRLVALLTDSRSPRSEAERAARGLGAVALWSGGDAATGAAPALTDLGPGDPVPPTSRPIGVIKLTSGTTGSPRGVATSTEALLADDAALRESMGIGDDDRFLATIPFSHSYGLSSLVVPALVRGLPLLLVPEAVAFDPLDAAPILEPTVFPTVPAYLAAHLRRSNPGPLPETLRLVLSAGAPLPPTVAARFREVHGRAVHVFYGASECGGITYDREGTAGERGTLGTPVAGVRLELEPAGDAQRVVVTSDAVAERYLPQPDDRLDGGRYRTEDLATFDDAELRLTGRLGSRINVRGRKVDPREVEAVIGRHGAVEDVRVVGVPRESSGDEAIRAVVACRPGGVSTRELAEWCRRHLADFKVPRSIFIVDSLPTNARGKVDRATLSRLARSVPPPDERGPER